MASSEGEGDEGLREPVAARPATTSGERKIAIKIELDRADAERLLQDLMGEFFIDKQRVDDFVQKHWAASEKGKIAKADEPAAKNKPLSR